MIWFGDIVWVLKNQKRFTHGFKKWWGSWENKFDVNIQKNSKDKTKLRITERLKVFARCNTFCKARSGKCWSGYEHTDVSLKFRKIDSLAMVEAQFILQKVILFLFRSTFCTNAAFFVFVLIKIRRIKQISEKWKFKYVIVIIYFIRLNVSGIGGFEKWWNNFRETLGLSF